MVTIISTVSSKSSADVITSSDFNALVGKTQNATDILSTLNVTANNTQTDSSASYFTTNNSSSCATFTQNSTVGMALTFAGVNSGGYAEVSTVSGLFAVIPVKVNGSDGVIPVYQNATYT